MLRNKFYYTRQPFIPQLFEQQSAMACLTFTDDVQVLADHAVRRPPETGAVARKQEISLWSNS